MINKYRNIYVLDFEYYAGEGERVVPICMVAIEFNSKKIIRMRQDELLAQKIVPFPTDENTLFVIFKASNNISCFSQLGWEVPKMIFDPYTEFRVAYNGHHQPICGNGLLGAMTYYGIEGIATSEKSQLRNLPLKGCQSSIRESERLMNYCESNVRALEKLFSKMADKIDWPRAILRGRYMAAVSKMENLGIPIDHDLLMRLRKNWDKIKYGLVQDIDHNYGVYDGLTFKEDRFEKYLDHHDISWPRTPNGALMLDDNIFKDMAKTHKFLEPLRELRSSLSKLALNDLAVGNDGRNRCSLSAFRSKTGRNQPSTSKYIFGPAVWTRGLIKPREGMGIAYIDWCQQEFGIGAALSKDQVMMDAYSTGDPYLAFAKQAGVIPLNATKESHPNEREQFKACILAVQYGMGAASLALRIGQSKARASGLLDAHKNTYQQFWKWSDAVLNYAMENNQLQTNFGWPLHVTADANPRSIRNFPMQASGAEMMRLACIFATEAGISVCGPIHDALLIEAGIDELPQKIAECQRVMEQASEYVLNGFRLRSEVKVVTYPDRYQDPRGKEMWSKVMLHLNRLHVN